VPNHTFIGREIGRFAARTADHCCAVIATLPTVAAWTYTPSDKVGALGNCTAFDAYVQLRPARVGVVSGWSAAPFNKSDVVELSPYSCLNGWTMGNLATTPTDLTRFYHALLVRKTLLRHDALEAMLTFHPMTGGGWRPADTTGYGLGIMYDLMRFAVRGGACRPPICDCASGTCSANLTFIGHAGQDWGSGVWVGRMLELNASVAIAFNSGQGGLNASLTRYENAAFKNQLIQSVMSELVRVRDPGFGGQLDGA
jgi:CubicO group peptidase (beta-lactamase class C family)